MLLAPASARSFLALSRSVLNLCGCGQATSVGVVGRRAEHRLGEAEQHRIHDLLIGDRIGDRLPHFELSNGGFFTFMPIYWMPFEYGVDTMVSLPSFFISEKSLFGRS